MAIRANNTIGLRVILALLFVTLMITSAAWAGVPEKVIFSLNGTSGNAPLGLSLDPAGNLWGVAEAGGSGSCNTAPPDCGTVFELTPIAGGWSLNLIYRFQGGTDGSNPAGNLAFDAQGNVYGATFSGGSAACQCGTVYKLTPRSGRYKESVIYRFNETGSHNDGRAPSGGLVMDAAGNLYGTTITGGNASCACGTVFELSPASGGGWTESILYNFKGTTDATDGSDLYGALVLDGQGNLYGTTAYGGTGNCAGAIFGCGVVFELSPTSGGGWTESILYNFKGGTHDGANPHSGLVFDAAGNLYGTTVQGGSPTCQAGYLGCGTVFELSPVGGGGWTENVIHRFSAHDGQSPYSGLIIGATGNLYGVTNWGGVFGLGTAFELTPGSGGTWTESILHSFGNGMDGRVPYTPLVFDSAGNLYGTTFSGGADQSGTCFSGCGAVFQLTP